MLLLADTLLTDNAVDNLGLVSIETSYAALLQRLSSDGAGIGGSGGGLAGGLGSEHVDAEACEMMATHFLPEQSVGARYAHSFDRAPVAEACASNCKAYFNASMNGAIATIAHLWKGGWRQQHAEHKAFQRLLQVVDARFWFTIACSLGKTIGRPGPIF